VRIETPKIVQPKCKPVYLWLSVFMILVAGAFLGRQIVVDYKQQISADNAGLQELYSVQLRKVDTLEKQQDVLRGQLAALERAAQIDQEATRQVKLELKQKQTQWQAMEEELNFLRHIASGKNKTDALYIQGFRLENGSAKGEYAFKFTVSQMLTKTEYAEGWVHLQVVGGAGESKKSLSLKEVTADKLDRIKMRFRHFQDIEGTLKLPKGFDPKSILIKVEPVSKRLSPFKKQFNWLIAG